MFGRQRQVRDLTYERDRHTDILGCWYSLEMFGTLEQVTSWERFCPRTMRAPSRADARDVLLETRPMAVREKEVLASRDPACNQC